MKLKLCFKCRVVLDDEQEETVENMNDEDFRKHMKDLNDDIISFLKPKLGNMENLELDYEVVN